MNHSKAEIIKTLRQAQSAFMEKNYGDALQHYNWVEGHMNDDPAAQLAIWIEIGWCHYLMKDYPQAIRYFEKCLDSPHISSNQRFDCLRLSGFSYEFLAHPVNALNYLQDALMQDVEEDLKRHTYFETGKILFVRNRSLEAKPFLIRALALLLPEELDYRQSTRYYLGFIAFFEGEYARAEGYFREIIAAAPAPVGQAPGYFGLAHIHYQHKDFQEVIDLCQQIIRLDAQFYDMETIAYFLCKSYMELALWQQLALFLPELLNRYPDGRYQSVYPELQKALQDSQRTAGNRMDLN